MNQTGFRTFIASAVLGLAFGIAGCGSDPNATPSQPSGASNGVTIRGTVNGGTASSSDVSAQSGSSGSGLRVTVVGTNLSTTTNGRGEFIIVGAPSGRIVLRFQGPGIDAHLELTGLVDGQTITISVQVSANRAEIGGLEISVVFEGSVLVILPPTLVVNARLVRTDSRTRFSSNGIRALLDLRIGDRVEIKGLLQSDNTVYATEVKKR